MPMPSMFYDMIQMDVENFIPLEIEKPRKCDCLLTSEKIRHVLAKFPTAQPIPPPNLILPTTGYPNDNVCKECIATNWKTNRHSMPQFNYMEIETDRLNPGNANRTRPRTSKKGRTWSMLGEMVQLLQFVVAATALALYYVIKGWMHLVYIALRVAFYFRNADKPMKITIGVVVVTSLVVGLNILLRIRNLYISILR